MWGWHVVKVTSWGHCPKLIQPWVLWRFLSTMFTCHQTFSLQVCPRYSFLVRNFTYDTKILWLNSIIYTFIIILQSDLLRLEPKIITRSNYWIWCKQLDIGKNYYHWSDLRITCFSRRMVMKSSHCLKGMLHQTLFKIILYSLFF